MTRLYSGVGEVQSPVSDPPGCAGRPSWWDWLCCPRRDLPALHPGARQLLAWQFCYQKADLGENTSFGAGFETDHQGCGLSCSQVLQPFLPGEGAGVGSGVCLKELGKQAGRHWLHWILGGILCLFCRWPRPHWAVAVAVCVSPVPVQGTEPFVGQKGHQGLSPQRTEWMRAGGGPVAGRSEDARACPGLEQLSWLSSRVHVQHAVHLETCICKSCSTLLFNAASSSPSLLWGGETPPV